MVHERDSSARPGRRPISEVAAIYYLRDRQDRRVDLRGEADNGCLPEASSSIMALGCRTARPVTAVFLFFFYEKTLSG